MYYANHAAFDKKAQKILKTAMRYKVIKNEIVFSVLTFLQIQITVPCVPMRQLSLAGVNLVRCTSLMSITTRLLRALPI